MRIESINLRSVYSFGNEGTPELKDFKTFNLFIGKNGSGKTNVFRALSDLKIVDNKLHTTIFNRNFSMSLPNKDLKIKTNEGSIIFQDGIHLGGDIESLRKEIAYFYPILSKKNEKNEIEEGEELSKNLEKLGTEKSHILWLAFMFIFNKHKKFDDGITELSTRSLSNNDIYNGTTTTTRYRESTDPFFQSGWSSGYTWISNLLIEFMLNNKRIILIDEPETHLEPRVLKKFLYFLFWLNLVEKQCKSEIEQTLINKINEDISVKPPYSESLEYSDLKKSVSPLIPRQIFISSHSPALINEFLKYSDFCSIYEFDLQYESRKDNQETLISVVREIKEKPHSILDNLGATGADLLQTNGVIWVEGPSDIIYIRKWLDMYMDANNLSKFEQGSHYEFQMFGGALLDSICYTKEEIIDNNEDLKKLVSMFSFSRNAFLVIDSDADLKDDGEIAWKSNFENAKEFISQQFADFSKKGYKLGLWYDKADTDISTLEDYLDDETIKTCGKVRRRAKKKYAEKVTKYWEKENKLLSDINPKLGDKIKDLYEKIQSWNT